MTQKALKARPTKVSIYLNSALMDLQDETKKSGDSFSYRIGRIVSQYKIIMDTTSLPEFSDEELSVIGNTFAGSQINKIVIRYMAESVEEFLSGIKSDELMGYKLIEKIKNMNVCQRVKLLDKIFND